MRAAGSNVVVKMCQEATWGVNPITPSVVHGIGFKSITLKAAKGTFESEMVNANRCTIGIGDGNRTVDGNLVSDLIPEGLEVLFMHLLGNPTVVTTGSGPYTHVMKGSPGNFQGLTIEKGYTDIDQYFIYTGIRIDSMSINLVQEGLHEITFGLIGKTEADPEATTQITGTPVSYTKNGFSGYQCVISTTMQSNGTVVDGAYVDIGFPVSGSLNIKNNVETDGFVIGSEFRASAQLGKRACSGEFSVFFEDAKLYELFTSGTEVGVKFTFDNKQGQKIIFEFPACKLGGNTPEVQNFQGLNLPLTFTAKYDVGEATDVKLTIVNSIASIEAGL